MKKSLSIFSIFLVLQTIFISNAKAVDPVQGQGTYADYTLAAPPPGTFYKPEDALMDTTRESGPMGGWALVDQSTGQVHGIHVCAQSVCGSSGSFSTSESTMQEVSQNAGCSDRCVYVAQSTADQNGNVSGIHGPNVTYDFDRDIFKLERNELLTEYGTNVSVSYEKTFEFGFQDFSNKNGVWPQGSAESGAVLIEVEPSLNSDATILSNTTQYTCSENILNCSPELSNGIIQLEQESIVFLQRTTSENVQSEIIAQNKIKLIENINVILTMLQKWVIN